MKTIKELNVNNKKVIVRVDYNVPMKDGIILDDNRIKQSLETINYLISKNAKIILMSHLGKIKSESDKEKNTLLPVAKRLSELINRKIKFSHVIRGLEFERAIESLKPQEILVIENTRYLDLDNNLESDCNMELAKYWSNQADVFILDAFGSAHRAHASTYGIPKYLLNAAGFLVLKEIKMLDKVISKQKILCLGGAKVEDKIGLIKNLINSCNYILVGGAMCATFLKAQGLEIGKTFVSNEHMEEIKKIFENYKDKIVLPIDVVTENGIKEVNILNTEDTIYDIGPQTIKLFTSTLSRKYLTICNGTMGLYENQLYENGTKSILEYLSNNKIKTIICGGDTASAVKKYNVKVDYISTGGGASLEYLSGIKLPALVILEGEVFEKDNIKS